VKQELKQHLLPLLAIFIIVSLYWLIVKFPPIQIAYLFAGLLLGSFVLDTDHIIYWYMLRPNLEESRLAQAAIRKYDFKSALGLLESTHKGHNNMVFHHYFFQVILSLTTFFVFTSSTSIFTKSFLLALNIHLLIDEINDFYFDKKLLQKWLFAREAKQLSVKSLKYYILTFVGLVLVFLFLLLNSQQ
jgi:hypothetical protein